MTQRFTAYSDGSCHHFLPNKPGGAAYIIFDSYDKEVKRASKGFLNTSNNRMELLAIVSIVNSLPPNSFVTIYSDSKYSINVLSGWWRASENLDLIDKYRELCHNKGVQVDFRWVRGHNGNPYNELCDQMARSEYEKMAGKVFKSKRKKKEKANTQADNKEELYYSQITTKGRRKSAKK